MATFLLAWELGGGLGHFMNLRPLAEGLLRRGHRVVAVLRDLSAARQFLVDPAVDILQAPFKHARIRDIEPTCTFAQILHNCGFGDADELLTLADAWRKLYDYIQAGPDYLRPLPNGPLGVGWLSGPAGAHRHRLLQPARHRSAGVAESANVADAESSGDCCARGPSARQHQRGARPLVDAAACPRG